MLNSLVSLRLLAARPSPALVYAAAVALPLGLTIVGAQAAVPAFVFEHLMVVVVAALAVVGGPWPAVVGALAGGIGDNVLLREPIGRPAITGARDAADLGLFLAVAFAVGLLVDGLRTARARALEAAARERTAREELDRVVATLTHDLANPLAAIQGTIQFARRNAAQSNIDVGRLLLRVETAAARATSLVRALSDARSIERHALALDLHPVDLATVVTPIVEMLDRTSDRHPIALSIEGAPLVVNGDAEHLGRVVENMIANAIKYSPGGGTIEIELRRDGADVVLSIRDHGIGIRAEERDHVFELGYRAPQAAGVAPGLGIGLYTSAEVIRQHGGTIQISEPNGQGTMFVVRLPRTNLPVASDSIPATGGEMASRTIH